MANIRELTRREIGIAKNDTTRSAAHSEVEKLLPPLTGVKCEPGGSLPRYMEAAR